MWRTAIPKDHPFDWLLVSSHLFAHQVDARGVPKLVYVHSPARYVWSPDLDHRGTGPLARAASALLKPLDRERASHATSIAANSEFVRRRIEQSWRQPAVVIHPPVDIDAFHSESGDGSLSEEDLATLASLPGEFILGVSRFTRYKNLDRVIAAGEASGIPVVLAGGAGEDTGRLRAAAAVARIKVTIVEQPSTPLLRRLLRRAQALVFPAIEDFGIVPVEAMASGTPVVGINVGGVTESVTEDVSGALVSGFEGKEIVDALRRVRRLDPEKIRQDAERFSQAQFRSTLAAWAGEYGISS